ncbi:MAG: hypothetical protein ABJN26_24580 [Stappiaceae bacterium]
MSVLTSKILAVIMIGSTHYVDVGKDADAIIYYPSETVAHMTLPNGPSMKGVMTLQTDGYHVAWSGGPAGDWKISYEPGKLTYIGPDGNPAGTVTKIVPGNPEKF